MMILSGDVISLIDSNSVKVVSYTYDAWGNPISKTGTLASTLGTIQPFRYRAYVYDEETGLYYLRSRFYSSHLSHFLNMDSELGESHDLFYHNACQKSRCTNFRSSGCKLRFREY